MFKVIQENKFFCGGQTFDQLLGVFETEAEAKNFMVVITTRDHMVRKCTLVIKEITQKEPKRSKSNERK